MSCTLTIQPTNRVESAGMIKSRQHIYHDLMTCSSQSPNRVWLAQIVASWLCGDGVLPDRLGLELQAFSSLTGRCFPGYPLPERARSGNELDFSRMSEKQDLEILLAQFAAGQDDETTWLIALIVAACLGNDHLWQDLGLFSRRDLSALLAHNFPELAARNDKDMKWKKFLYKQLCEAEGLYICRAPSCEVCQDYQHCFGAEE